MGQKSLELTTGADLVVRPATPVLRYPYPKMVSGCARFPSHPDGPIKHLALGTWNFGTWNERLAVGAVWSEPVSGPISLFYRENTGNFVDSASNRRDRSLLTH